MSPMSLRQPCIASGFRRLPWLPPAPSLWSNDPSRQKKQENPERTPMARLKFGAFLAPHHPIGEHPMLQFRRDLDFVQQLDDLGYDEFWCGEHHSSGWETIASPEMFLAAAGERTKRIKLGTGVVSLPTQWGFAEDAAKKAGTTVSRANWRVLLTWHIAETREQARREAGPGLMRWHNEYNVGTLQRPGLTAFSSPDEAVDKTAFVDGAASAIGTPDDLVRIIKNLMEASGGVGAIIGFAHDWANPENTRRSWDMVARYVVPEINGYLDGLRKSQKFVIENRAVFERAGQAVMAKIMENEKAAAALPLTAPGRLAIPAVNAPDLQKEAAKLKA